MTFVAAAIVGGVSLVTGYMNYDAAGRASSAQAAASDRAAELRRQTEVEQMALQTRMYDDSVKRQQPWLDAGVGALSELSKYQYKDFGESQFRADPGYQFRLDQGKKMLQRSAGSMGGLYSGGAMKALSDYGQNTASAEYANAFNRYQTEEGNKINHLRSMAGVGQTAVTGLDNAGTNLANQGSAIMGDSANNLSRIYMQQGQNQADGIMGQNNAITGALNGFTNWYYGSSRR